MQLAHARRNHLFTRAETVGDRHSLRSHLADGDLTLLKISMRVIAFHHPDYRLVLWPVIGVKHRLRWHNEGFPSGAGR